MASKPRPKVASSAQIAVKLAPFNHRLLLTGAGFSQNWGGYLAREIWSLILGNPKIRTRKRIDQLLHGQMNFEEALAEAEVTKKDEYSDQDRNVLRSAIMDAFEVQDTRMRKQDNHGLVNALWGLVKTFARGPGTTCLFTLNQDLLVERFLLSGDSPRVEVPGVSSEAWWFGRQIATAPWQNRAHPVEVLDDPGPSFRSANGRVTYIKLHGSTNWRRPRGDVMVLGGAKEAAIEQFRILRINTEVFRAALNQPKARLLVIGYGFADDHINRSIAMGVKAGLRLWIVDPMDPEQIRARLKDRKMGAIWNAVIGHTPGAWHNLFDGHGVDHDLLEKGFWS